LARGVSGTVPDRARLVSVDRRQAGAYDAVAGDEWDGVVEVSWQPRLVREALDEHARPWTYVSSRACTCRKRSPAADETADVLPATDLDEVGHEQYGAAKPARELASARAIGDRLLDARSGLIGGPGDHTGRSG
jgi:hypothetical protein